MPAATPVRRRRWAGRPGHEWLRVPCPGRRGGRTPPRSPRGLPPRASDRGTDPWSLRSGPCRTGPPSRARPPSRRRASLRRAAGDSPTRHPADRREQPRRRQPFANPPQRSSCACTEADGWTQSGRRMRTDCASEGGMRHAEGPRRANLPKTMFGLPTRPAGRLRSPPRRSVEGLLWRSAAPARDSSVSSWGGAVRQTGRPAHSRWPPTADRSRAARPSSVTSARLPATGPAQWSLEPRHVPRARAGTRTPEQPG